MKKNCLSSIILKILSHNLTFRVFFFPSYFSVYCKETGLKRQKKVFFIHLVEKMSALCWVSKAKNENLFFFEYNFFLCCLCKRREAEKKINSRNLTLSNDSLN
jgi:hypothetical protein